MVIASNANRSRINYSVKHQGYIVQKGNQNSHATYQGMGYVANQHIFTIHLKEIGTLIPDNFIAHFHLPPPYEKSFQILKGISISMSNSYLPISRKMILHRIPKEEANHYEQETTHFFEDGEEILTKDQPIIQYLRQSTNHLEYIPIPHPNYDIDDLRKERESNSTRGFLKSPWTLYQVIHLLGAKQLALSRFTVSKVPATVAKGGANKKPTPVINNNINTVPLPIAKPRWRRLNSYTLCNAMTSFQGIVKIAKASIKGLYNENHYCSRNSNNGDQA